MYLRKHVYVRVASAQQVRRDRMAGKHGQQTESRPARCISTGHIGLCACVSVGIFPFLGMWWTSGALETALVEQLALNGLCARPGRQQKPIPLKFSQALRVAQ
eukprot:365571-Chlamydomonas_euryale.AAC.7